MGRPYLLFVTLYRDIIVLLYTGICILFITDESVAASLTCAEGAMFFDTKSYASVPDKNKCAFCSSGCLSKSIASFVIL